MSLNPTMVTTSENALYLFLTVFRLVRLPHSAFPVSLCECIAFFYYYVGGYEEHCAIFPE